MVTKEHRERKGALVTGAGNPSQVVLYEAADGKVTVKVVFARDTFWLTQKTMADLFGVNVPAVNKHLANIYAEGELTPEATISKMETVQDEGGRQVTRTVEFYNLDAVIAVGYWSRRPGTRWTTPRFWRSVMPPSNGAPKPRSMPPGPAANRGSIS